MKRKTSNSRTSTTTKKRSTEKRSAEIEANLPSDVVTITSKPIPLDIWAFGDGENAELGLGPSFTESNVPRLNPFLDSGDESKLRVTQFACGGMHTVALTVDNKLVTWGVNDAGALGRDTNWEGGMRDVSDGDDDEETEEEAGDLNPLESTPTAIPSRYFEQDVQFVQVAAGDSCTFALTATGRIYGCGTFRNAQGDECFGYNTSHQKVKHQTTPALIDGVSNITRITCGTNHILALDKHGTLWGWGVNDENQLGRRLFARGQDSLIPQQLRICRHKIRWVASGHSHCFAVDSRGQIWGWGRNSNCEAGYVPTRRDASSQSCLQYPVKLPWPSVDKVFSLHGGANHSVALTTKGECLAWGKMDTGQLGIPFSEDQLRDETLIRRGVHGKPEVCMRPTDVQLREHIADVACGTDHTLFRDISGKVWATGFGFQGQLGLGSDEDVDVAHQIRDQSVAGRYIKYVGAGGGFSIIGSVPRSLQG